MRLYHAAFAVALLSGCTTISSTDVPVSAILAAATGFDAAERAATIYIRRCIPNPSPAGCNGAVVRQLAAKVPLVRIARNAAEQFIADNPDAKLGPATLVSAVTSAVAALQQIETSNNVKG